MVVSSSLRGAAVRSLSAVLVCAALFAWSRPAAAEDTEKARALNQKAIEAFKAEKFLDAIDFWLQAVEVASEDQVVKLHKNLGLALKGVERLPEAWYHLTVYLQRADQTDVDVAQTIRDMEDSLRKVHIKVKVETEPPGATVVFPPGDRMHRVRAPLSWWLPPGEYTVELVKDGYVSRKETLRVGKGEKDSYRFELAAVPTTGVLAVTGPQVGSSVRIGGKAMGPLPVTADLAPGEYKVEVFWEGAGSWSGNATVRAGERTEAVAALPAGKIGGAGGDGGGGAGAGGEAGAERPWWPWLLVGAGVATAAGGGVSFGIAAKRNNELADDTKGMTDQQISDRFDEEVVPPAYAAYALWGVGGALAAGGVIALLVTGGDSGSGTGETPVSFVPVVGPDSVGASLGVSF